MATEITSRSGLGGMRKFLRTFVIIIVLALAGFIYFKYFYVFGRGVKSGYLNYAVYKGQIFKTYEGKLILEGFDGKVAGTLKSNEFEFSIESKELYDIFSRNSGKKFDLQYKQYNGAIPWRGNTRYVVDSIIAIH